MASIFVRKDTNTLGFNFRALGWRFREQTALRDTPANRRRMRGVLDVIAAEITLGRFDYRRHFPASKNVLVYERLLGGQTARTPSFADFAAQWHSQMAVQWSASHAATVRQNLRQCLLPCFGKTSIAAISRDQVYQFRADLGQGKYSGARKAPGAKRINKVMGTLKSILKEAGHRHGFVSPAEGIAPLKETMRPVDPFTWAEISLILDNVRPDFRNYYTVRFLTGLRTGEIDGLRWHNVDFARGEIIVCEAIVNGQQVTTKTAGSQRAVQMSEPVRQALRAQERDTRHRSEHVFCLRCGKPLAHGNVTKRVWYPLLRRLGLKERRPYQTRHTTASLWMASGENPEWVARQLGHSNTQMLFKVYSRYIPNATRQDGSAFGNSVAQNLGLERGR